MREILVYCEKNETTFELLSFCSGIKSALGARLAVAAFGKDVHATATEYFTCGADKVYVAKALPVDFYADTYADALCQILEAYGIELVLIGSTRRGKELAARVAQKWGAGCITDAIGIKATADELIVDRYTLGGNTISSEIIKSPHKVISVMPKTFEISKKGLAQGEIIDFEVKIKASKLNIVERKKKESETVSLEEAENLVCIGKGLTKKEDLALIESLAKALNAEVGCTRPLSHDLQWLSEEREVGLSGKKCKPRLCLSIGISGQIQHTVGIRDSKIIAAINKDKASPIFEMADYGIVGDLYQVVPSLIEKIKHV